MVNYRIENITGASFSGTDGTGRTYTLAYSNPGNASFLVQVQGYLLTQYADFTISGGVLTINTYVANSDIVLLNYLTDVTGPTPSGTDYTTASLVAVELKAAAAFSSSTEPTLSTVSNWIAEESRYIDSLTNSVFSEVTASSEVHDYDGSGIFRFPCSPLTEVTTVEYNENGPGDSPSWLTLQSGEGYNYLEYLDEGEIEFIHGINATNKLTPARGKRKFRLTYTKGYATVPGTIQKLATKLVTKRIIESLINSQSNTEGGDIQVGTIRVSDPSNFSVNYVKQMNADIKQYIADIGQEFTVFRTTRVYD